MRSVRVSDKGRKAWSSVRNAKLSQGFSCCIRVVQISGGRGIIHVATCLSVMHAHIESGKRCAYFDRPAWPTLLISVSGGEFAEGRPNCKKATRALLEVDS